MASVHQIPRDQWPSHPNYPAQVLLLGSHENFRRVSEHLVERAQTKADLGYVERLYGRWISAMRSHEGYEEHKLYPYLAKRWGADFGHATKGHEALHTCDRDVRSAFRGRENVQGALRAHDRVLSQHLEHEETLVIPLLLGLSRGEFEDYARSSISDLLQRTRQRSPA